MLETEYKELLANVVPGGRLVLETEAKMEAAASLQPPSRKRLRTMLLAAVVLVGIIGASAIALNGAHLVDWRGNTLEYSYWEEESQEEWGEETRTAHQLYLDTIDKAPEDEIWMLKKGYSLAANTVGKIFYSYPEIEAYIRASAPDLLLPATYPEGYDFVFGHIIFYLSQDVWNAGIPFVSKEKVPSGHTLFKFKLPKGVFHNIKSFSMSFVNKADDDLRIECGRETVSDHGLFPVREGGSSGPVTMPGMEAGLFIQNPESKLSNELNLRKSGMEPKPFYNWQTLSDLAEVNLGTSRIPPYFYEAARYSLSASAFGKEELMKIAEGMK